MIDLHAHSFLSDGALLPAEIFRRAVACGYQAFAITDHVDSSNIEDVLDKLTRISEDLSQPGGPVLLPGVEITHVPPKLIPDLIDRARALGARVVLVHGETLVEPVVPGTNRAAIEGKADILAHPGLISEEDAALAAEQGLLLEISAKHSLANGHLVQVARRTGAKLVISSDAHRPEQLLDQEMRRRVGLGAGLKPEELELAYRNAAALVERLGLARR